MRWLNLVPIAGLAVLLPPALMLQREALAIGYHPAIPLAIPALIAGVYSAGENASLPAGVRHVYLLHYAALAGFASLAWIFPLFVYINWPEWASLLLAGGLLVAGPWTFGHLVACAVPSKRNAFALAGCATVVAMGFWRVGSLPFTIGFLALLVWPSSAFHPESRQQGKSGAGRAVFFFILLNGILGLGLIPVLVLGIMGLVNAQMGESPGAALWLERASGPDSPVVLFAIRWVGGIAAMLLGGAAVFAWHGGGASRLRLYACAGLGIAGAVAGGQATIQAAVFAALLVIAAVVLASAGLAVSPRGERWPAALVAAAAGMTLGLQCAAPILPTPAWGALLWLLEALVLGLLWAGAYWFGLRKIRASIEKTETSDRPSHVPPA